MERRSLFDDVRRGLSGKPIWNLISTSWTLSFSFIYFEEFIYSFSGKPIDPNINHAIMMMVAAFIGLLVLQFFFWVLTRKFKDPVGVDEMDKILFHRSLPVAHIILSGGVLLSLLGWTLHGSTEIVFHCVFLTLWISFGALHFILYTKHMSVMEKPSLFSLEEGQ